MSKKNDNEEVKVFEEEKKILLDHDYDGIKELDHPLPSWWITIFVLSVVFSIPYWIYYHHMSGPTLTEEYSAHMKEVKAAKAEFEEKQGSFNFDEYSAYVGTAKAKKSGAKTFKRKCKACHGASGEGGIGPNLTDAYWLHGDGSVQTVYKVIDKGVVDKGMQAWGESLGKEKLMAVVAYVMELKGTNPENAKEPQGEKFE